MYIAAPFQISNIILRELLDSNNTQLHSIILTPADLMVALHVQISYIEKNCLQALQIGPFFLYQTFLL